MVQDAPALRVLGQEVDVGGLGEGLVLGEVDSYNVNGRQLNDMSISTLS